MERTNANGERLIDLHMHVLDARVTSSLIFFLSLKKVLTTSEMNVNFKLETFILFGIAVQHSKGSQKLRMEIKSWYLENCPYRLSKTCLFQTGAI